MIFLLHSIHQCIFQKQLRKRRLYKQYQNILSIEYRRRIRLARWGDNCSENKRVNSKFVFPTPTDAVHHPTSLVHQSKVFLLAFFFFLAPVPSVCLGGGFDCLSRAITSNRGFLYVELVAFVVSIISEKSSQIEA